MNDQSGFGGREGGSRHVLPADKSCGSFLSPNLPRFQLRAPSRPGRHASVRARIFFSFFGPVMSVAWRWQAYYVLPTNFRAGAALSSSPSPPHQSTPSPNHETPFPWSWTAFTNGSINLARQINDRANCYIELLSSAIQRHCDNAHYIFKARPNALRCANIGPDVADRTFFLSSRHFTTAPTFSPIYITNGLRGLPGLTILLLPSIATSA
jgi:hypothetical protein